MLIKDFELKVPEQTMERVGQINDLLEENHGGGLSFDEACVLYELAAGLHDTRSFDTFNILELGTDAGHSSCIMGYALDDYNLDACVTTVDMAGGNKRAAMAREAFGKTCLANRYVCPLNFESVSFLRRLCRGLYRIILIDSDHSYQHVKNEIKYLLPHLEPGGWLVFHDYDPKGFLDPDLEIKVAVAVDEFLDETDLRFDAYKEFTLLCLNHDPSILPSISAG